MLSAIQYAHAWLVSHLRSERGQDLIEYALLGGVIALAIMGLVTTLVLTNALNAMADGIADCIDFTGGAGSLCDPGP
jgi:Flp pilus assembly pilin Flp